MSLLTPLAAYGIRQALGDGIEHVAARVVDLYRDHSQTLPRALARAHERAWQAVQVALAGDGLLDRIGVFFASGDDKGIREQVRAFLAEADGSLAGTPNQFRAACLTELKQLRRSKQLEPTGLATDEIARAAHGMRRYSDPTGLIDEASRAVGQVVQALGRDYPNLARFLGTAAAGRPPLLAAAFCFFFRREVENDPALAHGLMLDGLRQLTAAQAAAFLELNKAVDSLGDRFAQLVEQLDRIEDEARQGRRAAEATHGATLDLQAEVQRLGGLQLLHAEEVRRMLVAVQQQLDRVGMQMGEVQPQHSLSIRSADERRAVKVLLERFRSLPASEQGQVPALLNGLGKLQMATGEFEAARKTFTEVADHVEDRGARAEAAHNTYRADLERKHWDEALQSLMRAVTFDPARFAPFPLVRYRALRILGAGGFGTAFLCQDMHFDSEVVVKTLHAADLERGTDEVFREARILRGLSHPAIIGIHDCDYADRDRKLRPYLVMDYFPGDNLEQYLSARGSLQVDDLVAIARQVAEGMRLVHDRRLLHRDLKPANLLVRKSADGWQVKIIDFGLALRRTSTDPDPAARPDDPTVRGSSVTGTLLYAPPEQKGLLPGIEPGPYSDVFTFGKTCCQALFGTTAPRSRHLDTVPEPLRRMLERCIDEDLNYRLAGFDAVLLALAELDSAGAAADEVEAEAEEEGPSLYDYP